MLVKIAPMGERVQEFNFAEGSTIQTMLETAGVSVNGRAIFLNNEEVDLNDQVFNGNTMEQPHVVTLAPKMKGGVK